MSITSRVFAVLEDDVIIKLSNDDIRKLHDFDDEKKFNKLKNKKVRIASFLIELKDRKPTQILKDYYYYYEFDEKGKLDKNKYYEQMSLEINSSDLALEIREDITSENRISESNVLYGIKKYYRNRLETEYRWYPSAELKNKLHKKIFK
ncbi:MAG TPA: hypothetical protein VK982_13160 [Bacteroidales bacterium]|nr:hypothetical protein [Bacteroidales bacterium]